MRKTLMLVMVLLVFPMVRSVQAVSCGYERYKDDNCEIYLEYFPIVPADLFYPAASEEFPIKFYISQNDLGFLDPLYYCHVVPEYWSIDVYFRDDTCGENDGVTWKRWYPTSPAHNKLPISWSLGVSGYYLSLGVTVTLSDTKEFLTDYSQFEIDYNGKTFRRVGFLKLTYNSNWYWFGSVSVDGAGSIGIPNDLAQSHLGHHVEILVRVTVSWKIAAGWERHEWVKYTVDFILGDDIPSTTDCWLTVEQSRTRFNNPHPIPLGDINEDRRVDHTDIGIVYSMLGANPPPYNYRYCDMNVDGKVNYADFCSEFGYYLGWQTRDYKCVPSAIEITATTFGQAISKIHQKYP